ncbi:hypothetical protein GON03_22015 [Nocardioides sp. MAH-18]|uniref:Uncharacterized protein n=1 Tax=Nocardioides agri TaxID=2682843 RepID=A0A6L6Y2P9_9ACTN|nr:MULTISPECIES: hypothetical protein [unclassified Nocardioides]MBA2952703.1 hypothetical protein [Nocardioides sp. CGMCC 1.13656]MVQ51865.1 hypothetical protein [Nocardioides sp. MAH-18]
MDEVGSQRAKWIDRLLAQTVGPVNVQLSPEPGLTFPVEVFAEHGPGFVAPGTLGLSQQLEHDLIDWLSWWQRHVSPGGDEVVDGDDAEWRRWGHEGERLRQVLQQELGQEFLVRAY